MDAPLRSESNVQVPSHVLVQKHLQEVIANLKLENDRLKLELDEKIDCIPRKELEQTVRLLEDEKVAHAQTRAELMQTQDRLAFALGEVEILRKQLEREKLQFEETFKILKKKTVDKMIRNVELESECHVKDTECERHEIELSAQEKRVSSLTDKLSQQEAVYKQQLAEMNVHKEQEMYIAKLNEEQKKKRSTKRETQKKSAKIS